MQPAELAALGVEVRSSTTGMAQVRVARGEQKGLHWVSILEDDFSCSCGRKDCLAIQALKAQRRGDYPPLQELKGLARIDRLAALLGGKPLPMASPRRCPSERRQVASRKHLLRKAWMAERREKAPRKMTATATEPLPLTQERPAILVARAGKGFTICPNSPEAALALAEAETVEGIRFPTKVWDWALNPEEARGLFEERGLAVKIASDGQGFLSRRSRELQFNLTPLEELPERYPQRYLSAREKLSRLGWDDCMYEFQARDAAVMSLKERGFLTYVMGLGKTRTALAAAVLRCLLPQRESGRKPKPVLIVAESRTIELVWVEELERLGARGVNRPVKLRTREANVLAGFTFALVRDRGDLDTQADFHIISYTSLSRRQVRRDDARCPECRTIHHLASCPKCGSPYPRYKLCPRCGATGREGWTGSYCHRCGHSTQTVVPPLYRRMKGRYSGLIIDEFQLTAHKSLRGDAVRALQRDIPWAWGLSGTPIRNFIGDAFYPIMAALKGRTPALEKFDYQGGAVRWIETFGAFEEVKEAGVKRRRPLPVIRNERIFWELMAPWMIRRTLDDPLVAREVELPPLSYRVLGVQGSPLQMELYREAAARFTGWALRERLKEERDPNYHMDAGTTLQRLWELRHLATVPSWSPHFTQRTWPKMELLRALAEDAVERGRKVIVFSSMLAMTKEVARHLRDLGVVTVTGEVPIGKRPALVERWKRGDQFNIFNCTMGTMRLGVTLNADRPVTVILTNEEWSPATMRQAIKRAHRVNTKSPVEAYLILTEGTIDVYIRALVAAKAQAIDLAVDRGQHGREEALHIPTTREFLDALILLHQQEGGMSVPLGDREGVRRLRRLVRTLDITHCEPCRIKYSQGEPIPSASGRGLARWKGVRTNDPGTGK